MNDEPNTAAPTPALAAPKAAKAAAKNTEPQPATIEELAQGVPTWAAAALKARHGWPIGKKMLPSEYQKHLDALLTGHTDGDA